MRLKDVFVTSGGLVFQQVAQFLVGIYVAHRLGSEEYGTLSVGRNIINLLVTVTPLGLDIALLKFLPQSSESNEGRKAHIIPFLRIVFLINTIIMVVLLLGADIVQDNIYNFHHFALYFRITALSLPFLSMIAVYGAFYRSIGQPGTFALIATFMQTALRSSFNLIAVTLGLGASGVAGGTSAAALLANVFAWHRARGTSPSGTYQSPTRVQVVRVLHEAKWMAATLFVVGLTRSADIMVLGVFQSSSVVGSYSALSMMAYVVAIYPSALSQTMGPEVARFYKDGRLDQITRVQSEYIANVSIIAGFLFAGISVFAPRLQLLLGPSFTISPLLSVMLPLSYLVSAALSPMGYALSMTGHHQRELAVMASGGVLMIILLFALVPLFGGVGAAAAVVIAFSLSNAVRFVLVTKHIGTPPGHLRDFLPPILGLLVAFGAKYFCDSIFGVDLLGSLAGCIAYVLAFAALIWWVLFDTTQRIKAVSLLRRALRKG